ncbi:hypothetical protein [Janthinobacterium sp. PAMC25594]|uniref:hypothetical protein n=1 Tax=Janthinobacterium sp. PAMC25594 TaxID=2861284 RepID=UPI001C638DB8|nr:hypothetical protein [Janthinobacterium sp. PAMC25594]QYG07720.1 hypothetical protein KY494_02545 [Janthinobacterium sp. PAMC25594]
MLLSRAAARASHRLAAILLALSKPLLNILFSPGPMKKILIISLLALVSIYAFKQMIYNPHIWKQTINSPEHKLQIGSFIFNKRTGVNGGSQSIQTDYYIFKVIEINGDHVRLSVIRQLSENNTISQSDFSTTKENFEYLKKHINEITITGILTKDLFAGDYELYTVNDYLLKKYPALKKSRYYFEDIPEDMKNLPLPTDNNKLQDYFSGIYSKKEIIENGKLVLWVLNNSNNPELARNSSENIDLIQN